jgi:UDP-N-acetylmuramoyl-tripeptide--D-alanyl-D-alanine ligase
MKKLLTNILVAILGYQVKGLQARNKLTVVAVVGSIGKTSTKFAIARVLSVERSVRWQEGNYNHILTVPLIFFGRKTPPLYNPFAWLKIIISNQSQIRNYPYDTVVIEVGTDGPGQIAEFKKYLKVDIAVVTAVTPEHMEYFGTIDAVAKEEFSISQISKQLIINSDLCDDRYYAKLNKQSLTFGQKKADYVIDGLSMSDGDLAFLLKHAGKSWLKLSTQGISTAEAYSATAASVVANQLGMSDEHIESAVADLTAVSGRMQRLKGIKDSLIIDETYNASPDAMIGALDSLYALKASQKIALLGNMNELGTVSEAEHQRVGEYCDPKQLDYVVTLGPDANDYLAPIAESKGCKVVKFKDPYSAGDFIKSVLKDKATVLAKGSQNNVYAEEALKVLLDDSADQAKLVRQSEEWLSKKRKNFAR